MQRRVSAVGKSRRLDQRLLNEPTGTTGAAPDNMPLLLAAGTEKAVRISRSGARGGSASACFTRGFGAAPCALSPTAFGLGAKSRRTGAATGVLSATAFGGATSRGIGAATGALLATA